MSLILPRIAIAAGQIRVVIITNSSSKEKMMERSKEDYNAVRNAFIEIAAQYIDQKDQVVAGQSPIDYDRWLSRYRGNESLDMMTFDTFHTEVDAAVGRLMRALISVEK